VLLHKTFLFTMRAVLVTILVCLALASAAIINHQGRGPKPRTKWVSGENAVFAGKSRKEISSLLGWKPKAQKTLEVRQIDVPESLPTNFDSSKNWPNCVTIGSIQDQARCGSCWAFGAVESISDRFCIASKASVNFFLSFQDMVSCGPDDGCEGGDAGDAYQYAQSYGLVTAKCYPYTVPTCPPAQEPCMDFVDTPSCTQQCVDNEQWQSSKHFLSDAYGVSSNETQIRAEMFQNGPVEVCFDVYEDFLSYKSGVYSQQSNDYLGGHCVKCIGWGVDESGTPYWLCNNSWTTTWGDNGQFKILRGSDECGIEDDVVAGTPNIN